MRRGMATYTTRPAALLLAEARVHTALGRSDEVDRLVRETLTRPDSASLTAQLMLEAAAEMRGHGRANEAKAMAGRAAEKLLSLPAEKLGPAERRDLAAALLAAERWEEAIPLVETVGRERPREALRWKGLRALAALRSGDHATARRIDERLRRLARSPTSSASTSSTGPLSPLPAARRTSPSSSSARSSRRGTSGRTRARPSGPTGQSSSPPSSAIRLSRLDQAERLIRT